MTNLLSAMVAASKKVADPIAAAYASGNRPFTVQITRPGPPATFNRDTHQVLDPVDPVIYSGPARIYPVTGGVDIDIADERTTLSSARISIDGGGPAPRVDDVVRIVTTPQASATHLVNRSFTVTGVQVGGHFGIGYLIDAVGIAPSRRS